MAHKKIPTLPEQSETRHARRRCRLRVGCERSTAVRRLVFAPGGRPQCRAARMVATLPTSAATEEPAPTVAEEEPAPAEARGPEAEAGTDDAS